MLVLLVLVVILGVDQLIGIASFFFEYLGFVLGGNRTLLKSAVELGLFIMLGRVIDVCGCLSFGRGGCIA